jgi:O-antigen ligase
MTWKKDHVCGIDAVKPQIPVLTENLVSQVFGFAALAIVFFAVSRYDYRILVYASCLPLTLLIVVKPQLIPYLFILSFFTMRSVFSIGWMLNVQITDVIFLLLVLSFVSNKKIDIKAAFEKQRFLTVALTVFTLWTVVGYIINFYKHTELENLTSLLFVFNFFEMVVMVILLSQPQWKKLRDKLIFFYVMCSFCEIVIAISLEILAGARTFADFHKFTGTLGGHHAMLGNTMVLSFGVASCAFFELRDKYKRLFSLCVAILSIATILLSGTRSVMLGMLLGIPIIILLHLRGKWNLLIIALSVFAVFFIFGLSSVKEAIIYGMLGSDVPDLSAYGRLLIWERVYEYALYAPWAQKIVGIGVGAFTALRFDYFLEVGTFTTGAHNNFLHVFVEAGIVGLIIYLAIFIGIIYRLVLRSRYKDSAAKCFLLCTLILLFSCLTQETFWFNPSFGRFWHHYMFFYLIIFNFRAEEHPTQMERAAVLR